MNSGAGKELALIQPMHVHGYEPGNSHVYLPSSLSVIASQAITAGVRAKIHDQNLHELDFPSLGGKAVGVNLVGPPYVPSGVRLRRKFDETHGASFPLMMGGQIVNGFSNAQFHALFGEHSTNGNDLRNFSNAIGVHPEDVPAAHMTSMVPAYETIPDDDFKKYLSTEFCLYLSQGCKFGCEFCAAKKNMREEYRDGGIVDEELRYMVDRAKRLGVNSFEIYLSNLDLFQTPGKLDEFARTVLAIKKDHPDFTFRLRGLSTVKAFLECAERTPDIIERLREAGLYSISYGVDAATPKVWKEIHKPKSSTDSSIEAIAMTRAMGITPEVFMLFGHESDDAESMRTALDFLKDMRAMYGALPRPYVAKNAVPGNAGWHDPKNAGYVETLMRDPEMFGLLEYSTLATAFTHPNETLRRETNRTFLQAIQILGNTSQVIYPAADPNVNEGVRTMYKKWNMGRFDR